MWRGIGSSVYMDMVSVSLEFYMEMRKKKCMDAHGK